MFQIGDYIINSANGVCCIKEITTPDFVEDKSKAYFLIAPEKDAKGKVYVPVENAEDRYRKIMDSAQIKELLDQIKDIDAIWVDNDREREKVYQEAIRSQEPQKLVSILKTLFLRREKRNNEGKKNTAVDERYYKWADDMLCSEIGFVLNLDRTEVNALIRSRAKEDMN